MRLWRRGDDDKDDIDREFERTRRSILNTLDELQATIDRSTYREDAHERANRRRPEPC